MAASLAVLFQFSTKIEWCMVNACFSLGCEPTHGWEGVVAFPSAGVWMYVVHLRMADAVVTVF